MKRLLFLLCSQGKFNFSFRHVLRLFILLLLSLYPLKGMSLTGNPDLPTGNPDPPVISIIQPDCQISTGTINVTNPGPGSGFHYSIDNVDYSNTSGIFDSLSPGDYSVTVKNAEGLISAFTTAKINAPPAAPVQPGPFVTSAETVCKGGEYTYVIPDNHTKNLVWSYSSPGVTITKAYSPSSGEKDTRTWVRVFYSDSAASGVLSVREVTDCGSSAPREMDIIVRSMPDDAGIISGPSSVCVGDTAVYTVPLIKNATSYSWGAFYGATKIEDNSTNHITVVFGPETRTVKIFVLGCKVCGCGKISEIYVNVGPKVPEKPGQWGAELDRPCRGSTALYSVPYWTNLDYTWEYTGSGVSFTPANYPGAVYAHFSDAATSGILSVRAVSSCGVSEPRELLLTINENGTAQPGEFTDYNTNPCSGTKVVYTIPSERNTYYKWQYTGTGVTMESNYPMSGMASAGPRCTTNSVLITFAENATSGVLSVIAIGQCGPSIARELPITVKAKPVAPVISISGTILSSNVKEGNQWYHNNDSIPGADNVTYPVQSTGNYYDVVTIDGCSSAQSNIINVGTLSTGKSLTEAGYEIYPVPNSGKFTITITSEEDKNVDVSIYNSGGRVVLTKNNVRVYGSTDIPVDLNSVPGGMYYCRFISGNMQVIKTFILTK